jgi:hypothetical protein
MNFLFGLGFLIIATYTGEIAEYSDTSPDHMRHPAVHINTERTQITVQLCQHVPSAIGISWRNDNYRVYYIDPNSDLYGKIQLGDTFLLLDGVNPARGTSEKRNLGVENTPIQCVFRTRSGNKVFMAKRHPISSFSVAFQHLLGY